MEKYCKSEACHRIGEDHSLYVIFPYLLHNSRGLPAARQTAEASGDSSYSPFPNNFSLLLELLLKGPVTSYKLLPFSHRLYSVTTYNRPTAKTSLALSFLSPGSNSKFFIWTKKPTSGSSSHLHICHKPKAPVIFKEFQGLPQMYFKQKANDKLVAGK